MKLNIISFTKNGFSLSQKIKNILLKEDSDKYADSDITVSSIKKVRFSEWVGENFKKDNALIFIGAAGIAVRAISPFVKDKTTDPAVLVLDEKGSFAIPILSGHIGGANELARKIAALIGAVPVITTASDVNNLPAIDEYAKKNNLTINDMTLAKKFTAQILEDSSENFSGENSNSFSDILKKYDIPVSIYINSESLSLIPRCLILGIGCKKGKSSEELKDFVFETLKNHKIDYRSLEKICSVDLKKEEKAILSLSEELELPFVTFSAEELNKIPQKVSHSDFVSKVTGTDNVCERSVFAAGADELIIPKTSKNGMTLALGINNCHYRARPDNLF